MFVLCVCMCICVYPPCNQQNWVARQRPTNVLYMYVCIHTHVHDFIIHDIVCKHMAF